MVNKFKLDTFKPVAKEVISRTLEIASNYAGELSIEVIPLDKIELDPENNRELCLTLHDAIHGIDPTDQNYNKKKHDWKSLESLAKTIIDGQLINPIYVYRYGNKCRLIAGERRTLASAIAGKNEIIARIAAQRPLGTKLKILQWIENNERVDLTLAERIASLEAIIKEYFSENKGKGNERITAKLLSDLTGMSATQSRRYILILQAKPEIRQAIADGKLENVKLIELICSVEDQIHQDELFHASLSGFSFESVIKLKNELEINSKNKKELKGKQRNIVNLGMTKPKIVKILINALLSSNLLEESVINQVKLLYDTAQWNNNASIEKSFKKIVALIDTGTLL